MTNGCWKLPRRSLDLGRPLVMGILNVTPDSFSDGNRYPTVELAAARALELEAQGADILDIGGESTRPGAPAVSAEEELSRVLPVLEALSGRIGIPISVDTYKASVARAACAAGAEIINDISALTFDAEMAGVAAATGAGVVLMHTRGTPQEMQGNTRYADLIGEVKENLQGALQHALRAGIEAERIVLDPGIGFAKSAEGNLELIRRLAELRSLGRPILVGPSRKSFIGRVLGRDTDRIFGTAAAVAVSLLNGASIFRVHDVAAMRDVVDLTTALAGT